MTGSLAAVLAPRLSVIRWDQRGCGRSERRGRRLDELCARG
jgi:pimeloyl-ACP methyl ester carboxylesterase